MARGLAIEHLEVDLVPEVADTCLGFTAVAMAEVFSELEKRDEEVEMSVGILRSRFETYPPQQFDLTVLEEDILDIPITLGNHVVASGPRTLEERIESGRDWEQWLVSVEDVEEEERLVAEAKETAKAWVDSLVGDVDIAPK